MNSERLIEGVTQKKIQSESYTQKHNVMLMDNF